MKINGAVSTVVAHGNGSLTVGPGHGERFVHPTLGPPTPDDPLLIQRAPASVNRAAGYLRCVGRSGA